MTGLAYAWDARANELRHQWQMLAAAFDVDQTWVYRVPEGERQKTRATRIQQLGQLPQANPVVLVTPRDAHNYPGRVPLAEFKHPPAAIYAFGPDDVVLKEEDVGELENVEGVYLEFPRRKHVWSIQAASIVLWDRCRRAGS